MALTGPNEVKKVADPNLLDNLWRFNYRRGSAPLQGVVRARTREIAWLVCQKWCELNGFRTPAGIEPMVVADESILDQAADTPARIAV